MNEWQMWDSIRPDIDNLTALGLIDKAYVYGFDEVPLARNPTRNSTEIFGSAALVSMHMIFGEVKKLWPGLTTVATVNWPQGWSGVNPGEQGTPANCDCIEGTLENCSRPGDAPCYPWGWGIPDDLPVDIWVNEIAQYGRSDHYRIPTHQEIGRQQWLRARGRPDKPHQFFWYWCVSPEPPAEGGAPAASAALQPYT